MIDSKFLSLYVHFMNIEIQTRKQCKIGKVIVEVVFPQFPAVVVVAVAVVLKLLFELELLILTHAGI